MFRDDAGTDPSQHRSWSGRQVVGNKDALEKARLAARDFGFVRNEVVEDPVKPVEKAPFFADANDRFNRNYVAEERARREEKLTAYENKLVKKANQAEMRETVRWDKMENEFQREQARLQELQNRPAARTNKNSIPVNPINLEYHKSHEGAMKKYQDDQVRHRAARRSERLYTKMHSVDFDIITGQPKLAHQVPQVPPPPQAPQ